MTLVVMAAGIGSRYGGLKQTDSFGSHGEMIIDYSVYDSILAGFTKVVFIINKKIEDVFKETIGARVEKHIKVAYAFQELDAVPDGVEVSADRAKPLGTSHAIYCALDEIEGPFLVINADDFYGRKSFVSMGEYLKKADNNSGDFAMSGFLLKNTVSKEGYVSRGVCEVDDDSFLTEVVERTHIEIKEDGIYYQEDEKYYLLADDTVVSMNMWGFTSKFSKYLKENFVKEMNEVLSKNPIKGEYYLPLTVEHILEKKEATVRVIPSDEKWYGVTYAADKEKVVAAIRNMVKLGLYKDDLWS